jgi:hypothetical protein
MLMKKLLTVRLENLTGQNDIRIAMADHAEGHPDQINIIQDGGEVIVPVDALDLLIKALREVEETSNDA